jgi:hypothetical protein
LLWDACPEQGVQQVHPHYGFKRELRFALQLPPAGQLQAGGHESFAYAEADAYAEAFSDAEADAYAEAFSDAEADADAKTDADAEAHA